VKKLAVARDGAKRANEGGGRWLTRAQGGGQGWSKAAIDLTRRQLVKNMMEQGDDQ
jgi:hypothetical protein